MKLCIIGDGALADMIGRAAELRNHSTVTPSHADLLMLAVDIRDHEHLESLEKITPIRSIPIVVTSQVPPGWTRAYADRYDAERPVFCQPHTIISGQELECATFPDCHVVGCLDPSQPLPEAYRAYLISFGVPYFQVSYETAEMYKLSMSYLLAAQLKATNELAKVASRIHADWQEIALALKMDKRIGPHAYLRPGEIGGHLPRDVRTVEKMLGRTPQDQIA